MEMALSEYEPAFTTNTPMLPPHWRWLRSEGIIDGLEHNPTKKWDGNEGAGVVRKAVKFRKLYVLAKTKQQQTRLSENETMRDIFWAHHIWYRRSRDMRPIIQSLILADCPTEEIADSTGYTFETIQAYEALFFNVRHRLLEEPYIAFCVIGLHTNFKLGDNNTDVSWQLFGYYMKDKDTLMALATGFLNPYAEVAHDMVMAKLHTYIDNTNTIKTAKAIMILRDNQHTAVEMLNVQMAKWATDSRSGGGIDANPMAVNISAMMTNTLASFRIAGHDPDGIPSRGTGHAIDVFDNAGVELPYHSLKRIEAGQLLPNQEELLSMEFPPPPERNEAGGSDE